MKNQTQNERIKELIGRRDGAIADATEAVAQLNKAASKVLGKENKYNKAKGKMQELGTVRARTRFSGVEREFFALVQGYVAAEARALKSLDTLEVEYHALIDAYVNEGDAKNEKTERKRMTKELAALSDKIDKVRESTAASVVAYKAKNPSADASARTEGEKKIPVQHNPRRVNVAPVTIDVGSMVESAVNETMKKFNEALEARLAQLPQVIPAPVPTPVPADNGAAASAEATTATLSGDVSEINSAIESVNKLIAEAKAQAEKANELAQAQRTVGEMQKGFARDAQGIQVKQKLVMQEQSATAEGQDEISALQKQISDKQAELINLQKQRLAMIEELITNQEELAATLKAALASQRALINTSARNTEQLSRQISDAQEVQEAMRALRGKKTQKKQEAQAPIEEAVAPSVDTEAPKEETEAPNE